MLLGCHAEAFALGAPDRFYELYEADPGRLCLVHGPDCPFWPRFCSEYDPKENFFVQFAARTGKRVVAINNPIQDGFGREMDHPAVNVKRIYVVRDGRAVAASYARHMAVDLEASVREWYRPAIQSFGATLSPDDSTVFRYEDIVERPNEFLERIGQSVGIQYLADAHRYWQFDHHPIVGNVGMIALLRMHQGLPMPDFKGKELYAVAYEMLSTDPDRKFVDARWKDEYSERDLLLFDRYCGSLNERFGYDRDVFDRKSRWRVLAPGAPLRGITILGRHLRDLCGRVGRRMRRLAQYQRLSARAQSDRRDLAAVVADFQRLRDAAGARRDLKPAQATVRHYAKPEVCQSYLSHFSGFVRDREPDFSRSIGVDFGCWYGLSTIVLHRMGASKVYGMDILPSMIDVARAFADVLELTGVEFRLIPDAPLGSIPLEPECVDWVLANDVFSFAHPDHFGHLIRDIARVLRPGGTFYMSDGNNPQHRQTVARLLKTYAEYEIGDGTLQSPDGAYFKMRVAFLRSKRPDLPDSDIRRIARATAYRWGEEVLKYADAAGRDAGPLSSLFQPEALKAPIHPLDGRSIGAVTDPLTLLSMFECAGLAPELTFGLTSDPYTTREANLTGCGRFYLIGRKTEAAAAGAKGGGP